MVKIFIEPASLPAELEIIPDPYAIILFTSNCLLPDRYFFSQLIACGYGWEIDLAEATIAQANNWWYAHISARCERAFHKEVLVLLAGFPLTRENYIDEIWRYIREVQKLPEILDETGELLSLGNADIFLEHIWDEKSVCGLPS